MITSAIMNKTIQGITQRNFKQCSRDVNRINQPEQHKQPVLPVYGGHDTIQYEWNQLLNIRETLITNKYFRKIDHDVVKLIRKYRLNRRGRRGNNNNRLSQNGANPSNLIPISKAKGNKDHQCTDKIFSFSRLNAQSIKSTENGLSEYLHETKTDICIITETWLKPCNMDIVWCNRSELNTHCYRIRLSPCLHQRGGGLAIIYKSYLQVNLIEEGETRSFQFAKWQVRLNSSNNQVIFIVIYHPTYSSANLTTTAQFLDDFTNWLPDQILQMNNNINCIR